jgi:hypothetical protein
MRARRDDVREEPEPDLHELAKRVAQLRPCWQQPEIFFEQRSGIAHDLRRLAGATPSPGPAGPSEAERRLAALVVLKDAELARLRRLLAQAARPRPRQRRRTPDHRQMALALTTTT